MIRALKIVIFILFMAYESHAYELALSRKNLDENTTRIFIKNLKTNNFTITPNGNTVDIIFDKEIQGNLTALKGVEINNANINGNKLSLNLNTNNYRVRKFISDNFVGFDIIKDKSVTQVEKKATKPDTPPPSKIPEKPKEVVKQPAPVKKEEPKKTPAAEKPKTPVKTEIKTEQTTSKNPKNDEIFKTNIVNDNEKIKNNIPAVKVEEAPTNFVEIQYLGDDYALKFNWKEPVSAAIYKRAGYTYVFFNSVNTPPVPTGKEPIKIDTESKDNYTAYKFKTNRNIKVNRLGSYWEIILTEKRITQDPYNLSDPEVLGDSKLQYKVPGLSTLINYQDKVVGDNLKIFTVSNDTMNVDNKTQTTDYDIIPSILGVIIVKNNDNLKVEQVKNNLLLTSPNYKLKTSEYQTKESFFNFGSWRNINNSHYSDDLSELYYKITIAKSEDKTPARLKLVNFYLTNGLAEEALAALRNAAYYEPAMTIKEEYKILDALLNFLSGNYVIARNKWNEITLSEIHPKYHNEIKAWIAVANLKLNNQYNDNQVNFVKNSDLFMKKYPRLIRQELGLIELQGMIEKNQLNEAYELSLALAEESTDKYKNDIRYYSALVHLKRNEISEAIENFKALSDKALLDPKNRARAEFELTKLDYQDKKLSAEDTIKKLKDIGLVWRDNVFEPKLLQYLGRVAIDNKKFDEGFQAWQVLIENYPEWPQTITVITDLSNEFVKVFDEENLPDVEFAKLFFEYRELIPIGKKGDEIVRKMIPTMVKLDLLGQAELLLEHQIQYRSSGNFKNTLLNELAKVYILDKKPQKAIETLSQPIDEEPDFYTNHQKTFLMAKALIDLNQFENVFALLAPDLSTEAAAVRTEIFWRQKNWSKIKEELNPLTETWAANETPIDDLKERLIIKLAVTYDMLNDPRAVNVIKEQFYGKLSNKFNKKLIDYLVSNNKNNNGQNLDNLIGLSKIQNFMAEYKQLLNENNNLDTSYVLN